MSRGQAFLLSLFVVLFVTCDDHVATDVPIARVTKFPDNKFASLSITFDDGCPSVFTKIIPLLDKFDLKGTFFIIAGAAERRNEWEKWNKLVQLGHEVANHSLTHQWYLGSCTDLATLRTEIDSSYKLMTLRMGKPPFSFGHPFHSSNAKSDSLVFTRHYATKVSPTGFCRLHSLFDLDIFREELKDALTHRRWVVTSSHGIDDCFQPLSYDFMNQFLAECTRHSDSLYIDTFEHLSKYKIESSLTTIDVQQISNGFRINCQTDLDGEFDFPLTIEVTNVDFDNYTVASEPLWPVQTRRDGDKLYVTVSPNRYFSLIRK